ncbi:MAG: sugar transferase [Patescibacteria group bacterium]
MTVVNKKEPFILGIGDLLILVGSLVGALFLRYGSLPADELLIVHLVPFSIIFVYSIVVFYASGLYGRTINLSRSALPGIIVRAQIANGLIAVSLFYFIQAFNVTPKMNLFLYLGLSSAFLVLWRINTYSLLSLRKKQPALVIGEGFETDELVSEINISQRSGLYCKEKISPQSSPEQLSDLFSNGNRFRYIVADFNDERIDALLPVIYKNLFPEASIIDIHQLYEDIFDRIPLSCMNYAWIMKHISSISPKVYDAGKRLIDVILSLVVGFFALFFYPFVTIAIKIEDGGPVFIRQERIGKFNKPIFIYKYRSMASSDRGVWLPENENKVTRVGKFIRKSRIDELPQALSVLKGDMSLIGPRSDIVDLGRRLENEIPYYSVRTVIKPGVSGWAQTNQEKPPQSVEETKIRLSYDLYYVKHRSLSLDLLITLRTAKTLLSRAGM